MPPLAARLVCGAVWVEAPNDIRWLQVNGWFGQPSLRAPRSSSSSSRGTPSAAAGNVTGSVEVLAPEADLWQLSPEETLYLCSLGTIVLTEEDGDRISAMRYESAWQRLRQLQPNLAHTYAAYAYWRERGWVPRPGLQYGATFLLYRVGVGSAARHTHAEYCVIVEPAGDPSRGPIPIAAHWHTLQAAQRVSADVVKSLLICIVDLADDADTVAPWIELRQGSSSSLARGSRVTDAVVQSTEEEVVEVQGRRRCTGVGEGWLNNSSGPQVQVVKVTRWALC